MQTTPAADTPVALGYTMPAGWEPHAATWLGWSHHETDWAGKIETIRWVYGEMVRKPTCGEAVRLALRGVGETWRLA